MRRIRATVALSSAGSGCSEQVGGLRSRAPDDGRSSGSVWALEGAERLEALEVDVVGRALGFDRGGKLGVG